MGTDALLPEELDAYLERLVPPPPAALRAMEREGERDRLPLIDRQVGRLLQLLVELTAARRILEIGTAIGYSTAWLAAAAGPRGRVDSLEIDPERAIRARKNLGRAGLLRRVTVHVADARPFLEGVLGAGARRRAARGTAAMPAIPAGPFDLVFNDGAKAHYPLVARAAARLLRKGGLLVSDNALWSGAVASPGGDADTRAIREHNRLLMRGPAFTSIIVPARDGVLVARRA